MIKQVMVIGVVIISLLLLVWLIAFFYANDLSVPPPDSNQKKTFSKVLVVYPHADDEVLTSGGFISRLAHSGSQVTWVVFTRGEKGSPRGVADEQLALTRIQEAQAAARIYGITNLIQKDYPDGDVANYLSDLRSDLKEIISQTQPDLVITYDLSGLYGHPDHITVSRAVTEVVRQDFPQTKLWYASFPKRILDSLTLPDFMATDSNYKKSRVYPNVRVWVGPAGAYSKIQAMNVYPSQKTSFTNSFPTKLIPTWLFLSLTQYEYFSSVN